MHVDLVELEERLAVRVGRVAEDERHVEAVLRLVVVRRADEDVEQAGVLEADPARLLVDVVRDVGRLEAQAGERERRLGDELGRVGGVALLGVELEVALEVGGVGDERGAVEKRERGRERRASACVRARRSVHHREREREDARRERDVVDDEVKVLGRELDARERDLLEGAEDAREEDGRDVLPQVAAVDADEVVARLAELGHGVAEVLERVADGDEGAVVGGVVEELLHLGHEHVGVALPVGVRLDDVARAVVDRLELARRLVARDVARVVQGAVEQLLEVVPDGLDAVVALDVGVELVGGLERAVDRARELLDEVAEERDGVLGLVVDLGVDVLELGRRLLGGALELVLGEVEVLAAEAAQRVDGVLVLGLGLDLVDDGAPALDDGVLGVGRQLLLDVLLELRARARKNGSATARRRLGERGGKGGEKRDAQHDPS